MEKKKYISLGSGTNITNDKGSTIFNCPKCSKQKIIRSYNDRQISVKYTCPECGFTGPN
jgi:predicted RNA-binding Zn-ribbon protein involved in translation (DUF1610 family)